MVTFFCVREDCRAHHYCSHCQYITHMYGAELRAHECEGCRRPIDDEPSYALRIDDSVDIYIGSHCLTGKVKTFGNSTGPLVVVVDT